MSDRPAGEHGGASPSCCRRDDDLSAAQVRQGLCASVARVTGRNAMDPLAVGGIVLVCLFGGCVLGMALSAALPEHHLSSDARDAIKLATAIVATLSALAL